MTAPFSASEYVLLSAQSYYYYRNETIPRTEGATPSGPDGTQPLTTEQVPGLEGWSVDLEHSYTDPVTGFSATVFEKGGQYVVAYRGTDDWRAGQGDAEQNPSFAPGAGLGAQTREAIQFVEEFVRSTGAALSQISFTGHSLGGGLAGIASAYFNRPAIVFDPALYTNELRDLANKLSIITHSLYFNLPYDGIDADRVLFARYIGGYDPTEAPVLGGAEYLSIFGTHVSSNVSIYRVEGEVLDLFGNFISTACGSSLLPKT